MADLRRKNKQALLILMNSTMVFAQEKFFKLPAEMKRNRRAN